MAAAADWAGNAKPGRQPASARETEAAPSVEAMQRELQSHPRDAQSWYALARRYRQQRDYAHAAEAYERLIQLNAMDAQAWADYADVLGTQNGGSLRGPAQEALEHALALDPRNVQALWLEATLAHEEKRYTDALAVWRQLRAILPPGSSDVSLVDANIAEASQLSQSGAQAVPAAGTQGGPGISGTVAIDPRLAGRVAQGATLFIYAKAADSPGPPLAVVRTEAGAWPVSFHLDDSMAMLPSRRLSQFARVVVEARVSRSGQATPAAGDLYVTSDVLKPGVRTKLALVINHEIG
jgi:cytochrome c-type biogenesis protein CcmH